MRFNYLGHAGWLVEASGMRLLLDPILGDRHAGGVFSIAPGRKLRPADLAADFIFVSHVHFDHFDVESLARLAQHDAESVLVTSDELVARVAEVVGFRTVHRLDPGMKVDLAGDLSIATTPSSAPDIEWGTVFMDSTAVVWNMIDTVFPSLADVRTIRDAATGGRKLDLALAPIQTMREIAMATADHVGFRAPDHAYLVACAAATEATTVAPSACGEIFAPPYDALNRYVYPVSRQRAARDLERYAPSIKTVVPEVGEALVIEGGEVSIAPGTVPFERTGPAGDPRFFRPLEGIPMFDPNLDGRDPAAMKTAIVGWAERELAPGLMAAIGDRSDLEGISMVLEVVLPSERFSLRFDPQGTMQHGTDPEYDVLVLVAGSMLLDVIEGKRAWVEPLLGGLLRSSVRGASVAPGSCHALNVAPMFPYYAIGYRESLERSVLWRAERARAR